MLLLKGDVWIIDGRKGRLTVKLIEGVETDVSTFFDAELVAGTPHYMSRDRVPEAIGDTMTFRMSLTNFVVLLND